jgi:hypothetical protein
MTGRNVEIILGALVDAVRHGDPGHIAGFLAPGLVWEGVEPGLRCDGREQAMRLIRGRLAAGPPPYGAPSPITGGRWRSSDTTEKRRYGYPATSAVAIPGPVVH